MNPTIAGNMAAKLPLDKQYESRKAGMDAMRRAVLESSGHGIQIDSKASGNKLAVVRCPSLFTLPSNSSRGRARSGRIKAMC